jgi:hypothetical protein
MTVQQDPEYLLPVVRVIADVTDKNGNTMLYDGDAIRIIAALHAAGWALVTEADFDTMGNAYLLQEIRGGRSTTVPLPATEVSGRRDQP